MGKKKKNWNLIDTSLVSVLVAFQEVVVVVELRNETLVKGTLDEADQFMNVHMSNVTLTPFQGPKRKLDNIFIKGRNIRMVHLPHKINCEEQLKLSRRRQAEGRFRHMKSILGPVNPPKLESPQ
uniref:Sm domain-containing protein n=1 Tax=Tetraselmis sp. GSL018 TaxID=582737 RepID=A0A061QZT7_9CHLO|mmetsp:Transcript_39610/g.94039  ORF Transcript_39610/g.94039 Transcript_39610/m.94039 type:complete len:124 (-) Transcript_39610:160-531(-)